MNHEQTCPAQEPLTALPEPVMPALAGQLATARARLAKREANCVRARIELERARRRRDEELERARKYAIESFAAALLPLGDSLESALRNEAGRVESLSHAMATILAQLDAVFIRNDLLEIDPRPGDKLDPALHQVISMGPPTGDADAVAGVLQKGYRIGARLLRPALVTVARQREAGG